MSDAECSFLAHCEREFTGPELNDQEQEAFSEHLAAGCEACEERIAVHLSGSDSHEASESMREFDERLGAAAEFAGEAMAGTQLMVLARVRDRINEEDREIRRRIRRRHQRILFYVLNLVAVFLICAAYMGTLMAARVRGVSAKRTSTLNEINAMATALVVAVKEQKVEPPQDLPTLIKLLARQRPGKESRYYYRFESERLMGGMYLDEFGRPLHYRAEAGRAVIYSVGPNGVDDRGEGDDLARHIQFLHQ